MLSEKFVHTDKFAGCVDIITGIEDFNCDIDFDEENHIYMKNGEFLQSVTQILDDGSYEGVNEEILRHAQERGKLIHKEIQDYIEKGEVGFTPEFLQFLNLYEDNEELFKQKAIFDIKTYAHATPINRDKCFKQCQMYAEAIEYMTGEKIERFYMIHLPENKPGQIITLGAELETISEENKIKFCQTINLIKELEETVLKDIKEKIRIEMEARNIKSIEIGNVQISYREGYEKTTVDSKKLKEDGLYEKYTKKSFNKPCISIKIKNEGE